MTVKGCHEPSGFQTRRFSLASLLLLLCGVYARRASAQSGVEIVTFTDDQIEEIVATHNELRGWVDPPASNMQRVVSSVKV